MPESLYIPTTSPHCVYVNIYFPPNILDIQQQKNDIDKLQSDSSAQQNIWILGLYSLSYKHGAALLYHLASVWGISYDNIFLNYYLKVTCSCTVLATLFKLL